MIEYDIRLPDGRSFSCNIKKGRMPRDQAIKGTPWTDLDNNKCPNCPLNADSSPSCPLALDVQETLAAFKTLPEATNVDVVVKTQDRWYFKNLPIEDAFYSLFKYLMTTSGCPVLSGSPWERIFHIPFLSEREQAFMDLANQLINLFDNKPDEKSGISLQAFLKDNNEKAIARKAFLERCREASDKDSVLRSTLSHIEFVFDRKNDTTSLAMEINRLNQKAG